MRFREITIVNIKVPTKYLGEKNLEYLLFSMRTPIPIPMAVPIKKEVTAAHRVGLMIGPRIAGGAGAGAAIVN